MLNSNNIWITYMHGGQERILFAIFRANFGNDI